MIPFIDQGSRFFKNQESHVILTPSGKQERHVYKHRARHARGTPTYEYKLTVTSNFCHPVEKIGRTSATIAAFGRLANQVLFRVLLYDWSVSIVDRNSGI